MGSTTLGDSAAEATAAAKRLQRSIFRIDGSAAQGPGDQGNNRSASDPQTKHRVFRLLGEAWNFRAPGEQPLIAKFAASTQ
jgi:hypothetical protein